MCCCEQKKLCLKALSECNSYFPVFPISCQAGLLTANAEVFHEVISLPHQKMGRKTTTENTSAYWPIILLYIYLFFTFFVAVIDWLGTHFFCILVSHNSEKPNSKVQKTSQGCVCRIVTKTFRQQFTENWKWTTPFCDWSISRARFCREPV